MWWKADKLAQLAKMPVCLAIHCIWMERLSTHKTNCAGAAAVAATIVAGTLAYFIARFLIGMQSERAALPAPQAGATSSVAMHTTEEDAAQEETVSQDDVSYWDMTPEEEHEVRQQQVRIRTADVTELCCLSATSLRHATASSSPPGVVLGSLSSSL